MTANGTPLAQLPEQVRTRVSALTAEVLPSVPDLPAPLRKVAAFAPARRARAAGQQLAVALDGDDAFRERVATQVTAVLATPLSELVTHPDEADPVELAGLAWLVRPEGWQDVVDRAVGRLAERAEASGAERERTERLQRAAEQAEQALREARARHREELAALKAENADLRRKLGETRTQVRTTTAEAEQARQELTAERAAARTAAAAAERELRQVRARLQQHEEAAAEGRRSARSERDDATLRARVLLDTVLDAAAGLQRELSLPSASGTPSDRVEAALAAQEGSRPHSGAGALGPSSPALLEQYLAMPRSRLVVDGYNVSKTAWPSSSLEAQRTRLLREIAPLVARTGAETTVVFDAAGSESRPVVSAPRGVKVLFSPYGVIADDVIRDLVAAEPAGRVVVVVTNDRELGGDVVREGARLAGSEGLLALMQRSG
ncbi:NYN domain-containing protein [Nocardioides taihuensis]|uniref:NYN domain-containing protein n=1 Tax=Nocardioides taihuensis TaxID=1835606 RepID=A0ABW0BNX3_9ACTN